MGRWREALEEGLSFDSAEKPYPCSICAKCFSAKGDVAKHELHERTRTGEKPYPGSSCSQRFNSKNDVTRHGWTHTGDKPYPCSICAMCHVLQRERRRRQARAVPRRVAMANSMSVHASSFTPLSG